MCRTRSTHQPRGGTCGSRMTAGGAACPAQAPYPPEEECRPHSSDKWYDNCYKLWWHLATAWRNFILWPEQKFCASFDGLDIETGLLMGFPKFSELQ